MTEKEALNVFTEIVDKHASGPKNLFILAQQASSIFEKLIKENECLREENSRLKKEDFPCGSESHE